MTILLRIIGFHNCDGCSRKVRIALRRIGVKLVELDRETGNVTIATAENPEGIRQALERQLKKSVVVLSRDLVPADQNSNSFISHHVPANQTLDLQGLGEAVLQLAQALDGVEITSSNTIRINFVHRETRAEPRGNISVVEYAPPRPPPRAATEPSAPLMSVEEHAVYGYPPDFWGFSTSPSHDQPNWRCSIS